MLIYLIIQCDHTAMLMTIQAYFALGSIESSENILFYPDVPTEQI
jgi:hypothetical protein